MFGVSRPRSEAMATRDRVYFARRAAEEQELSAAARDPEAAAAHR
jgi:hypothetical protein